MPCLKAGLPEIYLGRVGVADGLHPGHGAGGDIQDLLQEFLSCLLDGILSLNDRPRIEVDAAGSHG